MAVNEVQQSPKPYSTSTEVYKNKDGLREKKQVVKNSEGAIIKKICMGR